MSHLWSDGQADNDVQSKAAGMLYTGEEDDGGSGTRRRQARIPPSQRAAPPPVLN